MSTLIPLHYYGRVVGQARVDPELGALPASLKASLIIPDSALTPHRGRPDILLARLLEPGDLLPRCHPFYPLTCSGEHVVLRISRIVLRPALVQMLADYEQDPSLSKLAQIKILASTVTRPVFIDQDRTNLTQANLRELGATSTVA